SSGVVVRSQSRGIFLPSRSAGQRLGVVLHAGSFGLVASPLKCRRQVVEAGRDLRMMRSERLLADRQSPAEQRLGLAVPAFGGEKSRQIVQAGGDLGMLRPESLLANRQRALEQGVRRNITPLPIMKSSQVAHDSGNRRVLRPQCAVCDRQRALEERL